MPEARTIWTLDSFPDTRRRLELTDLIRFRGWWICGFVEGDYHRPHPGGRARIIRSRDLATWETAALLSWDGAGLREPSLSITAEGWLMVTTSIYFVSEHPRSVPDPSDPDGPYIPPEAIESDKWQWYTLDSPKPPLSTRESDGVARQSVTWLSPDGVEWSSAWAAENGTNLWLWETTWHGGMGYCVGKEGRGKLLRTRDGKSWRVLKDEFGPNGFCNEASLAFTADGTAWCLMRDGKRRDRPLAGAVGDGLPILGRGEPPYYQEWSWSEVLIDYGPEHGGPLPAGESLRAPIGGPRLLCLGDGRLIAAGRLLGPGQDDGRITVFLVVPERACLRRVAECDGTTYPGLVEHEGRIWVSYGRADAAEIRLECLEIPS